jgi:hypothetical protein
MIGRPSSSEKLSNCDENIEERASNHARSQDRMGDLRQVSSSMPFVAMRPVGRAMMMMMMMDFAVSARSRSLNELFLATRNVSLELHKG